MSGHIPPADVDMLWILGAGPAVRRARELLSSLTTSQRACIAMLQLQADAESPIEEWVVTGAIGFLETLRAARSGLSAYGTVTAVVWEVGPLAPVERAAADALFEAVRGIVQSATLELPSDCRYNTLAIPAGGLDDAAQVLAYLTSVDGGFVAGASFDLRGRNC